MSIAELDTIPSTRISPAKAWLRALELTAPIADHPNRIFPTAIEEAADKFAERPALLSDLECLTYRALAERSNQYARWALDQGLAKGDVVCLMMPNRPEYMAIWLGFTSVGVIVALVNTNLSGPALAHCINTVTPRYVIASAGLIQRIKAVRSDISPAVKIRGHGYGPSEFSRIDCSVERYPGSRLRADERRNVTIDDCALYIYTSGTTGVPKAARVSHARLMQWTHWFTGMLDINPDDRLYNCLPMYHSVGGVLATGAILLAGGSVVIRESFSASRFWEDIIRWDCTMFQYIGELCRYLLHTRPNPIETRHRLRVCCGNGLRPEIWSSFQSRFRIPQILEFYAATEGNVSLFNVEGKPGAIGRIPTYLAHRFPAALVRLDSETEEPVRDAGGFCVRCGPNEAGEAIGQLLNNSPNVGSRFDGYTSDCASEKKILRNVFRTGDAWYRTGDLMRRDEQGYFYFVDRIGDTFRWKGENVATSEVSAAICAFPGIEQACVYGITVPGTEGRAGMAMLVAAAVPDLRALRQHLTDRLPEYAVPLFLRVRDEMEVTSTFKYKKNVFQRQGYDPAETGDIIYFNNKELGEFVRLDQEMIGRIERGQVRL